MPEPPPPETPRRARRLCGVLLADVTGFSRLMGEHETRAIAAIARVRDVFKAVVPRRGGTIEVQVGDCFVALFESAVEAVEAAIAIQESLATSAGPAADRVRIRIGVHLGEVVRDGSEVFGDSINIAARLQTAAPPGGIAVSEDVYRAVRSRVDAAFRDLGAREFKNIRGRLRVYEVLRHGDPTGAARRRRASRPMLQAAAAVVAVAVVVLGAAVYHVARRGPEPPVTQPHDGAPTAVRAAEQQPVVVGVMTIAARGDVPQWMRDVTRDGLNTILSKVDGLRVYSRQKIDFVREKQGLSELEAAEKLGISKMISGALGSDGARLTLELQVVDIASGLLDAAEEVSGGPAQLIELQNQLAVNVLRALNIALTAEQRAALFSHRTNDTLDGYRMLADTLGGVTTDDAPPARPVAPPPRSGAWSAPWLARAWAEPADGDEQAISAVLAEWGAALQAKDLERVAAVSLALDDAQKAALTRYFENAERLSVSIVDVEVLVAGEEALATFTRKDSFTDKRSGRDMQLEVRLSSELTRHDGRWKLRGVKKG